MTRFAILSAALLSSVVAVAPAPAVAQTSQEQRRFDDAQRRFDTEVASYRAEVDRYINASRRGGGYRQQGYNEQRYNDPRDNAYYDPRTDYRDGSRYSERTLSADERVYAGTDGRYYCKRNDGTTGLIVGAGAGGVLGNVIDGGKSRTVGTLLGALVGGVAGRAVEQNQSVRCR